MQAKMIVGSNLRTCVLGMLRGAALMPATRLGRFVTDAMAGMPCNSNGIIMHQQRKTQHHTVLCDDDAVISQALSQRHA